MYLKHTSQKSVNETIELDRMWPAPEKLERLAKSLVLRLSVFRLQTFLFIQNCSKSIQYLSSVRSTLPSQLRVSLLSKSRSLRLHGTSSLILKLTWWQLVASLEVVWAMKRKYISMCAARWICGPNMLSDWLKLHALTLSLATLPSRDRFPVNGPFSSAWLGTVMRSMSLYVT